MESRVLHWDFPFKLQFLESNTLILLNLKARKHFNFTCRKQQVILLLPVGNSSRYSQAFSFPLTSPNFKHTLACKILQLSQRRTNSFLACSSKLGHFYSYLVYFIYLLLGIFFRNWKTVSPVSRATGLIQSLVPISLLY